MKIPLRTNDGRIVGEIYAFEQTISVYKKVRQSSHMLQKPPAWTYDTDIIDEVEKFLHYWRINENQYASCEFVIETTDTNRVYRIAHKDFLTTAYRMPWRQDPTQHQWVVLLKYWSVDGISEQLKLF